MTRELAGAGAEMTSRMLVGLCCIVLVDAVAGAEPPEWFRGSGDDPYAVFSAWKRLSTRDAALAVGAGWGTVGGVLRDDMGNPVSNCPLTVSHGGPPGWDFSVWLQTDAEGRFVIYGTTERPLTEAERAQLEEKEAQSSEQEVAAGC